MNEILIGLESAITTSAFSILNPSVGNVLTSSLALITSIAILITNEFKSQLKTRYIKLGDWNKIFTLLYSKTLKQSTVEKKIDEKEIIELKIIYYHYLDER